MLVFLVMLIFLQNLRATLIAAMVIPVALLGGFLALSGLEFTINQLSLFGMVLAIGIVVDDAIVVIENVERIMREEGLSPRDATRKAMEQISGAVIAIAVVLMAVFVPSALQTGSVGAIYRQFALDHRAVHGVFRVPRPVLHAGACARPSSSPRTRMRTIRLFVWFNKTFDWTRHTYTGHVRSAVRHAPRWMMVFAARRRGCADSCSATCRRASCRKRTRVTR